jgi:hypothetical protein
MGVGCCQGILSVIRQEREAENFQNLATFESDPPGVQHRPLVIPTAQLAKIPDYPRHRWKEASPLPKGYP